MHLQDSTFTSTEFIANKVAGASEQVTRRYNDFYLASAFVTSQENWDQTSLGDLLEVVDEMVSRVMCGVRHDLRIHISH